MFVFLLPMAVDLRAATISTTQYGTELVSLVYQSGPGSHASGQQHAYRSAI